MKVILTGTSGMVGEGVMLHCLDNPKVSKVLSISRKPIAHQHPKLEQLLLKDFSEINQHVDQLAEYDACFFCAGVSSVGENEDSFTKKTFDLVVPFAKELSQINSSMTFTYVSGKGTDSSERGKIMWARVKGKTENTLLTLPFKGVYNFRPGFMRPYPGQKSVGFIFKAFDVLSPFWYLVASDWICTMEEVGQAMVQCAAIGYEKKVLEVADIKRQANAHKL